MKKLLVLLLAASLALSLCACITIQKTPTESAPAEKVVEAAPEMDRVTLLNAEVDGRSYVEVEKNTSLTATAVAPEGEWTLCCWEINGKDVAGETGNTLRFSSGEGTVVQAVYRLTKIVTCIDCKLQVIDAEGKVAAEKLETLNFEAEGTANVQITAEVPEGKKVAGWMINGVTYRFDEEVKTFTAEDIDEAVTYQPIFTEAAAENDGGIDFDGDDGAHVHSWKMKHNSTHHWYYCKCGATKNKGEHQFNYLGEVPIDGTWKYKDVCTVCGYTRYRQVIN